MVRWKGVYSLAKGKHMRAKTYDIVSLALAIVVTLASLVSTGLSFARAARPEPEPAPVAEPAPEQEQASEEPAPAEPDEREVFVSTWAERIDAFNAGYPLEGYGRTFAEAAYDYGVDPRLSPAIARVESGSGANCTYSCNAWGWGSSSWGDWGTAIWEQMGAFASAYGTTLSYDVAMRYNELDPDGWYAEVEGSMYQIWGSDAL